MKGPRKIVSIFSLTVLLGLLSIELFTASKNEAAIELEHESKFNEDYRVYAIPTPKKRRQQRQRRRQQPAKNWFGITSSEQKGVERREAYAFARGHDQSLKEAYAFARGHDQSLREEAYACP